MSMVDGPFLGMHLLWWGFWVFMMVSVFGFNVPERARVNCLDPLLILKRRFAKGEMTEDQYKKMTTQLKGDEKIVGQDVVAQTTHSKAVGHPIVDGLSLSTTWAIFYSLCALLYVLAPAAVMTATSKLFHGMSFTQMVATGTVFSLSDFISVLTIGAVYAFLAGVVWSLTHTFFLRQSGERNLKRLENISLQKAQLKPQTR